MAQELAVAGIVLNLIGVVLLFVFGMPFRVSSGRGLYIITESLPDREKRLNAVYRFFGYVGLALIIAGSGLQIASALET